MATRPIWRGHLRLALVSCPVALYNARHDRTSCVERELRHQTRVARARARTGRETLRALL
jgi:non-homologous end joining protein Ku